ncbi:hypothetical protein ACWT_8042 [Actinoplanes sp. SE50]|uniref:DUF3040 domain-containing protein n=1 Tax=unclassified Actinoplanes TaxID=2626549 RepID=UPI00023EE0DB|nr:MULTISPECIES: DUF3040 domain-containing protein [unclassified Actinoplanes]AEV89051.1 hypothetical protein ACPL_8173 [Actinoplanes sp. SE50/110]ATO87457.1 hypothetical protein ACWT_8042 [Actinoplanes sp. SE50]SLM04875.1 DUF3040 domain-containing protein [Actinoplanes sp. SE50/110]
MLEPREEREFDGMVARLRDADPGFTRRVDRIHPRQRRRWLILTILLWTIAPICLLYGGWTGALEAVLAAAYGGWLLRKRRRAADAPSWPSSTDRRPTV